MTAERLTDEELLTERNAVTDFYDGIENTDRFLRFARRIESLGLSRGLQRAAEELRRAAPNEGYVRTCMLAMADRFDREREGADGK